MNNGNILIKKLVFAALCLALCLVLPFLTGQIQTIGQALLPMHLPVLLCGFICGWSWGLGVGLAAPLLRSLLFGMPPMFPIAVAMAAELAAYGFATGLLYKLLPKKIPYIYVSLVSAMIFGRLIWGGVKFAIAGFSSTSFPFSAFFAGAVTTAIPGIICQIILVPLLVIALKKAHFMLNGSRPSKADVDINENK